MYLIEILHQTTTSNTFNILTSALYLIEILHQTTTRSIVSPILTTLYLIEILHQTTTAQRSRSSPPRCILSKFYIKPQPSMMPNHFLTCCILSKFYIKPQHFVIMFEHLGVVSYRNSTSNHNTSPGNHHRGWVVSYRNSTSNHNSDNTFEAIEGLYLIEILHQTTTAHTGSYPHGRLYLIEILHQTTTKDITV